MQRWSTEWWLFFQREHPTSAQTHHEWLPWSQTAATHTVGRVGQIKWSLTGRSVAAKPREEPYNLTPRPTLVPRLHITIVMCLCTRVLFQNSIGILSCLHVSDKLQTSVLIGLHIFGTCQLRVSGNESIQGPALWEGPGNGPGTLLQGVVTMECSWE